MEDLKAPGSKPRNPIVAAVFHGLNRAETKGTGIATMLEDMRVAGLSTPPIFESDRDKNVFDLILLSHHLLDRNTLKWLSQFRGVELSDAQRRALAFVRKIGAITNQGYRQLNGTDTLIASAGLRGLRDANLLIQQGKGSSTYYQLSSQACEISDNQIPSHKSTGSEERAPLTKTLTEGKLYPINDALERILQKLSPLHKDFVERIASLRQRINHTEMKQLIKDLCSYGPLQLEELACILDRDPKHLRDYYLIKMIRNNELVYQYPSQPAHPKQAYLLVNQDRE